jgi:hypothetical protein
VLYSGIHGSKVGLIEFYSELCLGRYVSRAGVFSLKSGV